MGKQKKEGKKRVKKERERRRLLKFGNFGPTASITDCHDAAKQNDPRGGGEGGKKTGSFSD